jgi:hypothetical protein
MAVNETDLCYTEESCLHPPYSNHFVKQKAVSHQGQNKVSLLPRIIYIYMLLYFTCTNIRSCYFHPTQPTFTSHVFKVIVVELTESCV